MNLEQVTCGHLGGYTKGGDPATWYPELWQWLVDDMGVRSVLDIGCGEGQSTAFFLERGCRVLGVEGIPQALSYIVCHDFTLGPFVPNESFDLVWCCEFVEHVEERFMSNFLRTFESASRFLLMTHASPGQGGHHHVNCQEPEYWIAKVEARGFRLERELTATTRTLSASNDNPWNHYLRSGLAFSRM
jgi:SAM-dependent methyltransferase